MNKIIYIIIILFLSFNVCFGIDLTTVGVTETEVEAIIDSNTDISFREDFVDTVTATWDTSELGIIKVDIVGILGTTEVEAIIEEDVPYLFVDTATVTWDTSEAGIIRANYIASTIEVSTPDIAGIASDISNYCSDIRGMWLMDGTATVAFDESINEYDGSCECEIREDEDIPKIIKILKTYYGDDAK